MELENVFAIDWSFGLELEWSRAGAGWLERARARRFYSL